MADRRFALLQHQYHKNLILPSDGTIDIGTPTAGHAPGWRDLVGQLKEARATGAGVPVWTQIGTTGYYFYKFDVGDSIQVTFHIDHDYSVGTALYMHAHYFVNGTDTNTVKWEVKSAFAKGHQQAAFDFSNPVVDTVEQAPTGTAYTHMIAEIADPGLTEFTLEVDGLMHMIFTRVTNGATDNADDVFLMTADCHYQADRFSTKNKAPDFYT